MNNEDINFIEQLKPNTYVLRVYIKTNAKREEIALLDSQDEFLTISLRSKPIKNKANRELVSILKKKLRKIINEVEISSGLKNSNKIIRLTTKESINKGDLIELLMN
jgi:uncharacterized protein (TIGR00251 family)